MNVSIAVFVIPIDLAAQVYKFKVLTIGQNPTDWKHVVSYNKPGAQIGCDFVGEVVELGSKVPAEQVKKGERRWGFVRGGISAKEAFAEYITTKWDISGVAPENITSQQAASIPIPFATAVQVLYFRMKIPEPPHKASGEWILIWSGATATGQWAIQLAKMSGLKVATTASQRRWPKLKELGADVVVDYKDPDVVQKLKEATKDSIVYAMDCIVESGSPQLAQEAMRTNGGGHYVSLLGQVGELKRTDIKTEWTVVYTMLGHDVPLGSKVLRSTPEDRATHVRWCKLSTRLLKSGAIKPLEVELLGGLEDVQKGFEMMMHGKNDCKLVYNVAPT